MLIVVGMVGIVAAIAIPAWLRLIAEHRVITTQGFLREGIQQAQIKSQQESVSWQFSVRENAGRVEMSVHPATSLASLSQWEAMNSAVQLDGETNFATAGSVYYVQFDEKGNVRYRLGRVTVSSKQFPSIKRCVIVSTLIGATRTARDQRVPSDGKLCY